MFRCLSVEKTLSIGSLRLPAAIRALDKGLERSQRARWRHGFCSRETREILKEGRAAEAGTPGATRSTLGRGRSTAQPEEQAESSRARSSIPQRGGGGRGP